MYKYTKEEITYWLQRALFANVKDHMDDELLTNFGGAVLSFKFEDDLLVNYTVLPSDQNHCIHAFIPSSFENMEHSILDLVETNKRYESHFKAIAKEAINRGYDFNISAHNAPEDVYFYFTKNHKLIEGSYYADDCKLILRTPKKDKVDFDLNRMSELGTYLDNMIKSLTENNATHLI